MSSASPGAKNIAILIPITVIYQFTLDSTFKMKNKRIFQFLYQFDKIVDRIIDVDASAIMTTIIHQFTKVPVCLGSRIKNDELFDFF